MSLVKHIRLPLLSLALLYSKSTIGNEIKISNADEFKNFVDDVNSGTNYSGTIVYLDSDLSLSGEAIDPIGKHYPEYFIGIFDGQGHIISNLKMNTSSQYTGLFGRSNGLTIKNVVLDSSCSITNSFNGSSIVFIGGIIGSCSASRGECIIENSANMADVTFSGGTTSSNNFYLGGIIGYLYSSSSYTAYVKNCANYGSVTHSGVSGYSYIGGVAGHLYGSSSKYKYLSNCLNYGAITYNGKSSFLYLGGIAGRSYYTYIENSVSAGKISAQTTPSKSYIGSIVGQVYSYTHINQCYCTKELNKYNMYGAGTPESTSTIFSYDNSTFKLDEPVSIGSYTGTSLVDAFNAAADYYSLHDYSKWLLNKEKKSVTFTISSRASSITMNYQIIVHPSLASEGSLMFDGWYNDNGYTNPLESFEVTEDTKLYGKFEENTNNYTITFDTRREGVSVAPITAQFGTVVSLPSESLGDYCSIASWETEYGDYVGLSLTMLAHNFTLYAVWKCTHIATLDDFVDFSKIVNSGIDNYSETTAYLDSDLSLADETLEPIGKDSNNYFRGVFDGQGHIISDLKMNTSSRFTGLFGCSNGLTIRNVMLDSSCSITSSYNGSGTFFIGGITCSCSASIGECIIENSVNMAEVTFSGGTSSSNLHLGGIVGYLYSSSSYAAYVKNCANYGSATHLGVSGYSYIGGVVGHFYGSIPTYIYLSNCLNYGTITHSGTTSSYLHLGGITGYNSYAYIENCISAGKISTQNTPSSSYIGSIVGNVGSYTSINYCYYTSDVGSYGVNGTGMPINTTGTSDSPTPVDSTLITELSEHTPSNGWNKWLLNANNETISFIINNNDGLNLSSQLILLPDPSNGWRSFVGWFSDSTYTTSFSSPSISDSTTLYGRWDKYVVKFDANGGSELLVTSIIVSFGGTYGDLPETNRTGYTFVGWFTDSNVNVTSETTFNSPYDHTLYARWSANSYTVIFDANGGNELAENETIVTFGSEYGELPKVTRTGYMFLGWFTNKADGTMVTNKAIVTTPNNHTLYAHWGEVTNQVEVVFNTKDLTQEKVEELLKQYTNAEFTIIKYEINDSGELNVIVKFTDKEDAEQFFRTINELSRDNSSIIKRVDFTSYNDNNSFSTIFCPIPFFFATIL